MNKRFMSLLIIFCMVFSLVGCTADNPNENIPDPSNGTQNNTKENTNYKKIIYSLSSEPETFDPGLNVYARSSIVLQNMFKGLYKTSPDDTSVPALVDNYTVDETGCIYTFTLKENLKWSDGKDLTAADFEYAWKRVLDPDTASGASWYLYYIKNAEAYNNGEANRDDVGVKVIDERTLEVTLENPTAYFLDLLCVSSYMPLRQDIVESNENWTQNASTLVSNGPFMVKEIKPKEKLVLVKNPYYVDADNVKLDELEIIYIESSESELAAYMNGDVDVSDNISPEAMTRYLNTPEYFVKNRIGTQYYDINCSVEPFTDARVRKALSMALDRDIIIKNIIQSTAESAYGFVPYSIPYAPIGGKEYRDVVGPLFEYNVEEAKKLLSEAGFPNGEGFPPINFITFSSQGAKDTAQAIQSMWKQNLGIETSITTFESKVYWDEVHEGRFDVAYDGWTGDYPDPMTVLDLFTLKNTEESTRWTGPEAEKYDSLIKENLTLNDNEKRYKNFEEAEKILMDEMVVIPIYHMNDDYLVKPHVKGVLKSYIGHTIFEYADVVK